MNKSSDRPGEVIVGVLIDKLREESDEWQTKYKAAVKRHEMEKQKLRLDLIIINRKCREQEMEIQKLRSTIQKMDSDYDDIPELVDSFGEEKEAAPCHRSRNSAKLSTHSDKDVKGSLQDCGFEGLQPSGFKSIFPELKDFDFNRLLKDCDRLNNFPQRTGSENDSRSDCGPPPHDCHRSQGWKDSDSSESEDNSYVVKRSSHCNKSTISKSKNPVKNDRIIDRCKKTWQKKKTQIFSSSDEDYCDSDKTDAEQVSSRQTRKKVSDKGVKGSLQDCGFEGLQPSGFKSIFPELTDFDFNRLLKDCDRLNNFPQRTRSENDFRSDCGPPPHDCHRNVDEVPSRLPASKSCDSDSLLHGQSFSGLLQKRYDWYRTSSNLAEEETSELLANVNSIQDGCPFKSRKYW